MLVRCPCDITAVVKLYCLINSSTVSAVSQTTCDSWFCWCDRWLVHDVDVNRLWTPAGRLVRALVARVGWAGGGVGPLARRRVTPVAPVVFAELRPGAGRQGRRRPLTPVGQGIAPRADGREMGRRQSRKRHRRTHVACSTCRRRLVAWTCSSTPSNSYNTQLITLISQCAGNGMVPGDWESREHY